MTTLSVRAAQQNALAEHLRVAPSQLSCGAVREVAVCGDEGVKYGSGSQ
jgi:hypothetical protein